MQLVVFTLGAGTYALPIECVQEIIRDRPRTAGVISLRGRLLPVRDIAADVGAGALGAGEPRIVVLDGAGGSAGILVDGVDSVVTVAAEQLAPVPAAVATDRVSAIAQLGDDLVLVLDAAKLLAGVLPAPEPEPEPAADPAPPPAGPARAPRRQPSRKRSEKATRSTGGAKTGSPSKVTA